jgi:hypothetical protein
MDKNKIFVVLMLALSVISLGITLSSTSYAVGFFPGGGTP